MYVSDALSRLYTEENHKITDIIPVNFLQHTQTIVPMRLTSIVQKAYTDTISLSTSQQSTIEKEVDQ